MRTFNPRRLILARKRRRLTAKALADIIGISAITVSRWENGNTVPEDATLNLISKALGFPSAFFLCDDIDEMTPEAASFRSLTSMSAKERDSALAAGAFAYLFSDWIAQRFNLPSTDLPNLSSQADPETGAHIVRQEWGLGNQPISSMIKLLESKGVRVFSLAENTKNVDAFSCWRDNTPYIFLNTFKSTEHSRFDAAHELGHLILHKHGGPHQARDIDEDTKPGRGYFAKITEREAEMEANRFASCFLMPTEDISARVRGVTGLDELIQAKKRWGVSVAALAYRLHKMKKLSDWQYRSFCIEMSQRGYRYKEPEGLVPETSVIWQQVLSSLWNERITKDRIADDLNLPIDELENMLFNLTAIPARPNSASLKLVN